MRKEQRVSVGHICILFLAFLLVYSPGTAQAADYYVDATNGNNANSGLSWGAAKASIGAAMGLVNGADTINVAAGAYSEKVTFHGSSNNQLLGGYPAGGGVRAPWTNTTIIEGTGLGTGGAMVTVPLNQPNGWTGIVIDGFTIRNGTNATAAQAAGIHSWTTGVTISNCVVENNTGSGAFGIGGIYFFSVVGDSGLAPTLERNIIRNNAGDFAGGLYFEGAGGNTINYNAKMINNLVVGNRSTGNDFNRVAAIAVFYPGQVTITNSTIADNTITGSPATPVSGIWIAGFDASEAGHVIMINSILWHPGGDDVFRAGVTGTFSATFSDIEDAGDTAGTGNFSLDPQFVSALDYHPGSSSPCIDAGTATGAPLIDLDGVARPQGSAVDCGAYELAAVLVPEISVTDSVDPVGDLQIPFGDLTEMTSSDQTVTVTNDGDSDLVISQIAVTNPLAAPFSILNDTCSNQTVAPAANCTLTVRFSPPSPGASADSFDIPSNDGDENPVTISVSGTGISALAPEITVTDSVDPAADLQVPFGDVTETTSSSKTVTVTNDGNVGLLIGQIAVVNPLAAPFSILNDTCSNQTVAPAANCTLTVRFSPPSPGASADSFDIPSNDGDENPVTVSVSGTGTATPPPDSNGDGISDADAIALGLDPNDVDGDTDGDGISDVIEVGVDINNPMDNDGDGVIDALEPGADASNAETASGLQLPSGDSVAITTATGEMLSQVSTAPATGGPGGINFPFGTVSYTTTSPVGGSVTVRMTFSVDLPGNLVIYKVDNANVYTVLPTTIWTQIDARTVDITLTDGDPLTDLDGVNNGSIDDPMGAGGAAQAGIGGGGGGGGGLCSLGPKTASAWMAGDLWLLLVFVLGLGLWRGQSRL